MGHRLRLGHVLAAVPDHEGHLRLVVHAAAVRRQRHGRAGRRQSVRELGEDRGHLGRLGALLLRVGAVVETDADDLARVGHRRQERDLVGSQRRPGRAVGETAAAQQRPEALPGSESGTTAPSSSRPARGPSPESNVTSRIGPQTMSSATPAGGPYSCRVAPPRRQLDSHRPRAPDGQGGRPGRRPDRAQLRHQGHQPRPRRGRAASGRSAGARPRPRSRSSTCSET